MIQIGRESISRPLGRSLQSGHSLVSSLYISFCQLSLAEHKDGILKQINAYK